MEWRYEKLKDIAKLTKGRTPPRTHMEYYAKTGLPWVKIENLKRRMVYNSEEYLSLEGQAYGRTVLPGSVLLSVNRTIGKVGIAGVPLQTNEQIIAVSFRNREEILPEYLYYYFMFSEKKLQERAYVTVGSRISMESLKEFILPIPSLKDQREWCQRLKIIEEFLWQKEDMLLKAGKYSKIRERDNLFVPFRSGERAALKKLDTLLKESIQISGKLLFSYLNQLFWEADHSKEAVFYGSRMKKRHSIEEMQELDDTIKALLANMSFFQQCLYREFYEMGKASAIHTVLKKLKEEEPALASCHIQDAVTAVESFRQLGLMIQQEEGKLYYTAEKKKENEVIMEDGSNVTIKLWNCSFPDRM